MDLIRDIVQQALDAEYLTLEAEARLRQMLRGKYESADLKAFMLLQRAIMTGQVRQEAREQKRQLMRHQVLQ